MKTHAIEAARTAVFLAAALAAFFAIATIAGCDEPPPPCPDGRCPTCPSQPCPTGTCPQQPQAVDLSAWPAQLHPCPPEANPWRSVPPVDLPPELCQGNWLDGRRQGSCMHAALVSMLRWQRLDDVADQWRQSHAGPECVDDLLGRCQAAGLTAVYTIDGNEAFLDWCSRTRRGAVIHWYVSQYGDHAVLFCGYDAAGRAVINDNNRPKQLKRIERARFLSAWHRSGGRALTTVYAPPPPRPWVPLAFYAK